MKKNKLDFGLHFKSFIPGCLVLVGLMSLCTTDAYAYFDPASGSSIVQIIIGVLLAGAMVIKLWYRRLRRILKRLIGKRKDSSSSAE